MLLPLSGLLAGVAHRMTLIALVISYYRNPNIRFDTVFLSHFNINKRQFALPICVVTPFGDAGRGKA